MAKASRTLSAPTRLRNPRRPTRPHTFGVRGLVSDEDDDVMLTPPLRVEHAAG
jgi:hypothetical protein